MVGPSWALDRLYAMLRRVGGRELIWRAPGHYDHLHYAHSGELVGPGAPGWMPGLKSDERVRVVQTGERIIPRRGGDGAITVNVTAPSSTAYDIADAVRLALRQHMVRVGRV